MKERFVKQNGVLPLSKSFALRIIQLHRYMVSKKKEFVLSQQLLRSGTSIGANIKEAQFAQSKADFIAKMYIALKESGETEYWLELLHEAGYLTQKEFESIITPCQVIIRMLSAITKTARINKSHTPHSTLHT
ncbi:four helix bundle protein [Fibrobacter sp.]|uniref:four helix bundle protein n=1 Tax=Fibrobacter sp. TaxID=35828 RepID=UPI003890842C